MSNKSFLPAFKQKENELSPEAKAAFDSLKVATDDSIKYHIGSYESSGSAIDIVLQEDGIYDIRENKLGIFKTKIVDYKFKDLDKVVSSGIEMKVPKIPSIMIRQMVTFYREVYDKLKSEVGLYIFYNPEEDEFFFHVPSGQTVNGAHVDWKDGDEEEDLKRKFVKVLESHSHNTMGAFWSSTDNKDKQDIDGFDMVVGKIDEDVPEFKVRYKIQDFEVNLKVEDIFDIGYNDVVLPDEFDNWEDKLSKTKYSAKNNGKTGFDYNDDYYKNWERYGYGGYANEYWWEDEAVTKDDKVKKDDRNPDGFFIEERQWKTIKS